MGRCDFLNIIPVNLYCKLFSCALCKYTDNCFLYAGMVYIEGEE